MTQFLEMLKWLIYNSFIPLLPVSLVWFVARLRGVNRDLLAILRDGQLYFYCTAISAGAIGDILTSKTQTNEFTGIIVGAIIFLIIFSTFLYGVAVGWVEMEQENLGSYNKLTQYWLPSRLQ